MLRSNDDLDACKAAVELLGGIGHAAPQDVAPALVAALSHNDKGVQLNAIQGLGGIVPFPKAAAQAVPALIDVLRSKDDPNVRQAAAEVLERIKSYYPTFPR